MIVTIYAKNYEFKIKESECPHFKWREMFNGQRECVGCGRFEFWRDNEWTDNYKGIRILPMRYFGVRVNKKVNIFWEEEIND